MKILTLNVLKSLVINEDVHLMAILGDDPTIDITLGGVKILTLNVLKSLVVNVDVHLVVILEDKSNYRCYAWWSENLNS